MMAGGTDQRWGAHLRGGRVGAIVSACNARMAEFDRQLIALGGERWRIVSVAEAHLRAAQHNLERIDGPFRRAHDHVLAISRDERAPKKSRHNALAWLGLFEEKQSTRGLAIMREFADEILKLLPDLRTGSK